MEAIRVICQKGKFVEEKLVELTGGVSRGCKYVSKIVRKLSPRAFEKFV